MTKGYDNSSAQAHLRLYLENPDKGHRIAPKGDGKLITTLLLTTTGRKSGAQRTTPLIYKKVGDIYVIVASLGGAPNHPAWYHNLMATPECEIQVGHACIRARARTASSAERELLWQEALEQWPDYADYQARTQRQIPVVVLEPTETA